MKDELLKKLRFKEGQAVVLNAPEGYGLGLEGNGTPEGLHTSLLVFVGSVREAEDLLPTATGLLEHDAVFWIAYPKKAPGSKVKPDINRDILAALVQDTTPYRPVSNVAIDDTWSALRFRLKELVQTKK
ncbi:hypothetical protein [Paenibacillus puerhi]|uniref:hypothetical protein n=1 Tax=Paenibacillus puerhi TaxID=2692622 RepID=UPI0013598D48|nr:hypothetical protein [Paenibacillus puerhi]